MAHTQPLHSMTLKCQAPGDPFNAYLRQRNHKPNRVCHEEKHRGRNRLHIKPSSKNAGSRDLTKGSQAPQAREWTYPKGQEPPGRATTKCPISKWRFTLDLDSEFQLFPTWKQALPQKSVVFKKMDPNASVDSVCW